MRIYLPATLLDLAPTPTGGRLALGPLRAHAVTPALRALFPDDEDEGLEYAAQLAAADDSLDLLGRTPQAPRLRLVLAADVADSEVSIVADDDAVPSAVDVAGGVPWDAIVCAHVDEPAAEPQVVAALAGEDDALEHLDERDLLWYDASEFSAIPR
ncbi:DUF6912 family protein [Pengzhenrongella phosphoraccumulans]|uniref:DUF6912 family protein n=1 Tax=Pengzhenrongella phosphoraccumulans TaxID=3114394 RepID=UPI00388DFAB4